MQAHTNHISAPHRLQLRLDEMTHWGIIQNQIFNQVQDQAGHAKLAVQQSLEGAADAAERNISPTPHPACRACPSEGGKKRGSCLPFADFRARKLQRLRAMYLLAAPRARRGGHAGEKRNARIGLEFHFFRATASAAIDHDGSFDPERSLAAQGC